MSGKYELIWFVALIMAFVSAIKYNRAPIWRKIFAASGLMVVVMIVADGIFDIVQTQPKSTPKIEQSVTKPAPPKVETPSESFYKESYDAIEAKTRMRVTETWLLEFGERVTPDGNVDTHGFVELNGDGVKRQFWLVFDGRTRECLRVKIDGALIYTAVGW